MGKYILFAAILISSVAQATYVRNNPLRYTDPTGLYPDDPAYIPGPAGTQGVDREAYDRGVATGAVAAAAIGTAAVVIGPPAEAALSNLAWQAFRKGGFLNDNQYLRIGFSRDGGDRVFRIAGDLVPTEDGHIILKNYGPLKTPNETNACPK